MMRFFWAVGMAGALAACGGRTALDFDTPSFRGDDASTDASADATGNQGDDDAGASDDGGPASDAPDGNGADGAAPDQAVTTYLVNPAHTSAIAHAGLTPPLARAWTAQLDGAASYPLVVGGVVYVTTTAGKSVHAKLVALDAATGSTIWTADLDTASAASLVYEQGLVFEMDADVPNYPCHLRAYDASTGALAWTAAPDNEYYFDAPPVAYRGILYVWGEGDGGTLYAYDEKTGNLLWRQLTIDGSPGAPAVSDDGVFVAEGCQQVHAFDRTTGNLLWQHQGSCTGGGGATPVLLGHTLYVRDPMGNLELDAASGVVLGSFTADLAPAYDGTMGYAVASGSLRAFDLGTGSTAWTFAGDGRLTTAPLVADGYVYVGSSEANLFAVRASGGAQVWMDNTGLPLQSNESFGTYPRFGLAATQGLLFVPSGSTLLAYASASVADAGADAAADAGGDAAGDSGCTWTMSLVTPSPTTGLGPWGAAIGDLNGDGRLDLAVVGSTVGTVDTLLGNGDGTFGTKHEVPAESSAGPLDIGDFNRDGKLDVVVANMYSGSNQKPYTLSVFLGNGDGTLGPEAIYPTGNYPVQVVVRDLNGDGSPDLAVAAGNAGLTVHLGKGDGTFLAPVTYPLGVGPVGLVVEDLNGDGKLDVAMADENNQDVEVLLGNGDGTFQKTSGSYPVGHYGWAIAVGDVNGDAKPDLAVSNGTDQTVSVLLGNGDGTFRPQTTWATGLRPESLAIGDLNGDGRADIVVSNALASTVSVLLGHGDGTFDPQFVLGTGAGPGWLGIADLNADGWADLAVVDGNNDTVDVFLGKCGG